MVYSVRPVRVYASLLSCNLSNLIRAESEIDVVIGISSVGTTYVPLYGATSSTTRSSIQPINEVDAIGPEYLPATVKSATLISEVD